MTYARIVRWAAAPLMAALALTCAAGRAAAEPPVFIVVSAPPGQMETYPSVDYDGHSVYNVDGRYYYRDGERWGYYREAPPALRRYRWERRAMREQAWREHARRDAFHEQARREAFHDEARRDAFRDQARRAAFREPDRREDSRERGRGRHERTERTERNERNASHDGRRGR